ncbi:hypothetical protein LCGC14_0795830 [marine sediment metagenome]|uniref:Uncharacterized protein n=1 Tax=marine sediment metagenome TaxID=412755 RepID=A0A0F9PVK5_9ZZZZ
MKKDKSVRIKKQIKNIEARVRQSYGAYSSLQAQLHSIFGIITEVRLLFEEISTCFNELFEDWKEVMEKTKK